MGETLDAALAGLFEASEGAAPPVLREANVASPAASSPLAGRALEHYERARAAQRADDWATYGEEMRKLGEVLRELERQPTTRP